MRAVFDYRVPAGLAIVVGTVVEVPFGRRSEVGVVVAVDVATDVTSDKLKTISGVCAAVAPLGDDWLELCRFAAHYYLRGVGEVVVPALPPGLREPKQWPRLQPPIRQLYRLAPEQRGALDASIGVRAKRAQVLAQQLGAGDWLDAQAARAQWRDAPAQLDAWAQQGWLERRSEHRGWLAADAGDTGEPPSKPVLTAAQADVVAALEAACAQRAFAPFLLHGITGSGKTEVYLRLIEAVLAANTGAQVLMLVPEINLTPQLEARVRARFPDEKVATMHSGVADGERTRNWLAAHAGEARIVLGTRLAMLASLPQLAAIIVDEEHDPSFKQQEGLRYSARDLAVWRAKQRQLPIVLGSATPSLESWAHAQQGHYRLLSLPDRAQDGAQLPAVRLIDLGREAQQRRPLLQGLSQPLLAALKTRLDRGEQSLLYLNRRGYAPVIHCDACGWLSGCPRCSAWQVLHREGGRRLCCHHCGHEARVPHHCPDCGNQDLQPLGQGTQRLEEALAAQFPTARIARIDADATRHKGSAQTLFDEVHRGDVDILVGTQMVAKGHDFQRVTLVGIVNPDGALYSHDFRAGERLFAQLMQVAGRAGRAGLAGEVMIQTRYPAAPLYQALVAHDYAGYAQQQLREREGAWLPPASYQALLTAEAGQLDAALAFLRAARDAAAVLPTVADGSVVLHDPVPRAMMRIARRERAQLLIESGSRAALQTMLDAWLERVPQLKPQQSWQLERDPAQI